MRSLFLMFLPPFTLSYTNTPNTSFSLPSHPLQVSLSHSTDVAFMCVEVMSALRPPLGYHAFFKVDLQRQVAQPLWPSPETSDFMHPFWDIH